MTLRMLGGNALLGAALVLSGCGLVGSSNPVLGTWKITRAGGMGQALGHALVASDSAETFVFTADHLRLGNRKFRVKYKIHGHDVAVYEKTKSGAGPLIARLKLEDHNKKMVINEGIGDFTLTKVS